MNMKQNYLYITRNFDNRRQLCKLRISNHKLAIETGHYNKEKIDASQRLCILCSNNAVETELHFIFSCPFYDQLRQEFFSLIKNEINH